MVMEMDPNRYLAKTGFLKPDIGIDVMDGDYAMLNWNKILELTVAALYFMRNHYSQDVKCFSPNT